MAGRTKAFYNKYLWELREDAAFGLIMLAFLTAVFSDMLHAYV